MKYLKLFEDVTTSMYVRDEVEWAQSIQDVFIDLMDDGFRIMHKFDFYQTDTRFYALELQIDNSSYFTFEDVEDKINMMVDVMKSKWVDVSTEYRITYDVDGKWAFTGDVDVARSKKLEHIIVTIEKVKRHAKAVVYKPQDGFIKKLIKKFI